MPFPVVNGLRSIEFGSPGEMRSELTALVLAGAKRATAGLLSEYEAEGEPVEHVGERLAVLDNDSRHVATIEVTRVEMVSFDEVPDEFALAEGEGDLSAADFRASHLRYWTRVGIAVDGATPLSNLYFDLVEDHRSEP